jgi:glycosyltransferase involved in cell wall biosynthesis
MDISIVIPVYNEERNVLVLAEKLRNSPALKERDWEAIFVDDGSTDTTYQELLKAKGTGREFKIIRFGINAGKAAAYTAGFQHASGEVIVTMDGDLQDDPDEIGSLLNALGSSEDLVVGWKYRGKGSAGKALPSRLFNRLLSALTGLRINDSNCPFRAMRRDVARALNVYGDLYRFIPYLASQMGYRVVETKVENLPRRFGKSKYGPSRFYSGLLDLLTVLFISRYRKSPLHFFGIPGFISLFLGLGIDSFLVVQGLFFSGRIGHTALLLMGVMLILVGIQFLSLGLLGELVVMQQRAEPKDLPIQEVVE